MVYVPIGRLRAGWGLDNGPPARWTSATPSSISAKDRRTTATVVARCPGRLRTDDADERLSGPAGAQGSLHTPLTRSTR